jgi:hypothetical protein
MALKCGFFDSTTAELVNGFYRGNKAQDAAFFARREAAIVGNGVYQGAFVITAGVGLTAERSPGQAWINGYYCYDDDLETVEFTAGNTYYYVLRLHTGDGEITEQWLTSYTEPVRTGYVYDLLLAVITIPPGEINLTANMICDRRGDSAVCGYARLQPTVELESIAVNADDVIDSDNHMIPIKTGSGSLYLKDNGIYGTLDSSIVIVSVNTTLSLSHSGVFLAAYSSNNITITVPSNSAVPFPVGTELEIVRWGTGTVAIGKSAGVTLRAVGSPASIAIAEVYAVVVLKKVLTDEWLVTGAIG